MSHDLSQHHQPIGEFLDSDQLAGSEQFKLDDQQVQFFQEQGYLSGIRLLNDRQVDRLCDELETLFNADHKGHELWHEYHSNESADPNRVLFHALGAWRIQPGFHDLLWNRALTVAASQLLQGAVRFWHDQLFCKPARHGGSVAWHQDYSYWTRTKPMSHLTCWIGLDDSTSENGCLQYLPTSHRWDLLPITGLAGDMDAIRDVLDESQWKAFQNSVAVELKRGECSFHHPLLVHGSGENQTNRPRRAVVVNVFRDGVISASDQPLLKGVPPVASGEKVEGQFFPLLYHPDYDSTTFS